MNDYDMFDLYVLRGEPLRRHKGKFSFERYEGRGKWKRYDGTDYAKQSAVPMTPDDFAALVEAHDLALDAGQYDEQRWRIDRRERDELFGRAVADCDLSRGEHDRADFIAGRLLDMAQDEITRRDRLRPRTAVAGVRGALALIEHWSRRAEIAAFDRLLPAHEAEDHRARVHITIALRPGAYRVGRSPEGATIVLLAEGVEAVQRFLNLPYLQAVKEFRDRWVPVPQDSDEATDLRYCDRARERAALETWRALRRVEEECLLGLLKAFGGDRDRLEQALRMCRYS